MNCFVFVESSKIVTSINLYFCLSLYIVVGYILTVPIVWFFLEYTFGVQILNRTILTLTDFFNYAYKISIDFLFKNFCFTEFKSLHFTLNAILCLLEIYYNDTKSQILIEKLNLRNSFIWNADEEKYINHYQKSLN